MNQEILSTKLDEIDIFNTSDVEEFNRLNIYTVEELLGATKGLKSIIAFENFIDFTEKFERLTQMIPEDTLEIFRSYKADFPMGYIIDNPNNTPEDDEI